MCNEQCFAKTMWILCCHWIASISCYLIKKREKSDSSSCSFLKISLTRGYIQVIITKRSARAEAWNRPGELSERFKVQSWKGCVVERLPRVRISYSPPVETTPLFKGFFCPETEQDPRACPLPGQFPGSCFVCMYAAEEPWFVHRLAENRNPRPFFRLCPSFPAAPVHLSVSWSALQLWKPERSESMPGYLPETGSEKTSENRSQYHPFRCW